MGRKVNMKQNTILEENSPKVGSKQILSHLFSKLEHIFYVETFKQVQTFRNERSESRSWSYQYTTTVWLRKRVRRLVSKSRGTSSTT
jgi:hypothetical protein